MRDGVKAAIFRGLKIYRVENHFVFTFEDRGYLHSGTTGSRACLRITDTKACSTLSFIPNKTARKFSGTRNVKGLNAKGLHAGSVLGGPRKHSVSWSVDDSLWRQYSVHRSPLRRTCPHFRCGNRVAFAWYRTSQGQQDSRRRYLHHALPSRPRVRLAVLRAVFSKRLPGAGLGGKSHAVE